MDPLSQAVFGANLSQFFGKKKNFKLAGIAGALGGLLPDIDILISSETDPLLALEYHRHFTHSLAFVLPLGAFVAWVVWCVARWRKVEITYKEIFMYASLGVLTHGLLDACTSYGTQLFWPFSNARIAWNNISIIDPLLTLPGLAGVLWAHQRCSRQIARFTLVFLVSYLLFGVYQRNSAEKIAADLAQQREHRYTRLEAKPSFGNIFLFRTLYETHEGIFYVDAVHTLPWLSPRVFEGSSIAKWKTDELNPALTSDSVLAHDIWRFDWFSDGYLVQMDQHENAVGDLRYSILPNGTSPLWGIVVDPQKPDKHIEWVNFRRLDKRTWSEFKKMLFRE